MEHASNLKKVIEFAQSLIGNWVRGELPPYVAEQVAQMDKRILQATIEFSDLLDIQEKMSRLPAPTDQDHPPVLFNPYTGKPRDPRDVSSDPQGVLIIPPGAVLRPFEAYRQRAPKAAE